MNLSQIYEADAKKIQNAFNSAKDEVGTTSYLYLKDDKMMEYVFHIFKLDDNVFACKDHLGDIFIFISNKK